MSSKSVRASLAKVCDGLEGVQRELRGSVLSPPQVYEVLSGVEDLLRSMWAVVRVSSFQVADTFPHGFVVGVDGGGDPAVRLRRALECLNEATSRVESAQVSVNEARQALSLVHVTADPEVE
jgi:hypothetical protein